MAGNRQKSQRGETLGILLTAARQGREVPVYELARIAVQFGARIKELRAEGFHITNRQWTAADGSRHSAYRLHLGPSPIEEPTAEIDPPGSAKSTDCSETLSLFPDALHHPSPKVWRDTEENFAARRAKSAGGR